MLIYKGIWIFVFYGTDFSENRSHVHVGKRDTRNLCKIWLEPDISIAKPGDLSLKELNLLLEVTNEYKDILSKKWSDFVAGRNVEMLKIK